MARSNGAVESVEVSQDPKAKVPIMFQVPADLKQILEDKASEQETTLSSMIRRLVADYAGYELPKFIRTRAKKYATEEDRIEAQKLAVRERNDTIKKLLKLYRSGDISPELLSSVE